MRPLELHTHGHLNDPGVAHPSVQFQNRGWQVGVEGWPSSMLPREPKLASSRR